MSNIIAAEEIGGFTGPLIRVQGTKIIRTYERNFVVITNSPAIGGVEVILTAVAFGLPTIGSFYQISSEQDLAVFCDSIDPRQDAENPVKWTVRVTYTSDFPQQLLGNNEGDNKGDPTTGGQLAGNPLLRPVRKSFSFRNRKRIFDSDYSTPPKPFIASNGERFDPPIELDAYNLVIVFQQNVATFDYSSAEDASGAVNIRTWQGFPRRTAKMIDWRGEPMEDNGIFYYEQRQEIEIQRDGWDIVVLNQGSYGWTNDGMHSQFKPINKDGMPMSGKVLLDASGQPLVDVTSAATILAGAQTVTPSNMISNGTSIKIGMQLIVDPGAFDAAGNLIQETVVVTAVAATTFTATFANAHLVAPVRIQGVPTYQTFNLYQVDFNNYPGLTLP